MSAALGYVPSYDLLRTGSLFPLTLRLFNAICKRWLARLKPWLDFGPKIAPATPL
jgi:hypothetical protein